MLKSRFADLTLLAPSSPQYNNGLFINQKINQKIFWELKKRKILVRTYPERGLYEFERITVGKPEDNDRFVKTFKECLEIGLQG